MNHNTDQRGRGGTKSSSTSATNLRHRHHQNDNDINHHHHDDMEIEDAPLVNMITCNACGREVPEWNLAIHQVRACRGNAPRVAVRMDDDDIDDIVSNNNHNKNHHESEHEKQQHENDESMEVYDSNDQNRNTLYSDIAATATAPPEPTASSNDTIATPGIPIAAAAPTSVIDLTDDEEQWTCHQCTLFNDLSDRFCAACGGQRPRQASHRRRRNEMAGNFDIHDDDDDCRRPDEIRREQLLPSTPTAATASSYMYADSPSTTPGVVSSGALIGGMLGGVGAFLRGRPVSSAVLEGAITGAVGAAVAQQAWQQTTPPRLPRAATFRDDRVASARSSAAMGLPVYPSVASAATTMTTDHHNTARPRRSRHVVTSVTRNGTTYRTYVQQGGDNGTVRINRNNNMDDMEVNAEAAVQQFLAMLGHNQPPFVRNNGMNIDGMSYDQLLDAFGDGTEGRRGASEATIHSLPTQVLQQDEWGSSSSSKNPEKQTCSICLESYQKGQTRKCLPCLHGFHQDCIDTWLRSNASCPICKHHLS